MTEGSKFSVLGRLAQVFLAIPATSAPSERIWSRTSGVLTTLRNRLAPELATGTMFMKENFELVRKHWEAVTKGEQNPPLLFLPPFVEKNKEEDVGQDLFELLFNLY